MAIELTSPACLLLGLVQLDGQICQVGIALQHPPIQLLARAAAGLAVSGARADLAHAQAEQFYQHYRLPPRAELEIELAVPSHMGLGSDAMLGLSVARALASLDRSPADDLRELTRAVGLTDDEALEAHASAQGGLLLVDGAGDVRRRHQIAHRDEADDWVFVFLLPRVPPETPERLEADRRRALREAAEYLAPDTGQIATTALWPAVEHDDIAAFAEALIAIQALNRAALAQIGQAVVLIDGERAILEVIRKSGALAWGRSLTGLGLYGLIRGAGPSRELRRALTEHVGYFGGMVIATICDNNGARHRIV